MRVIFPNVDTAVHLARKDESGIFLRAISFNNQRFRHDNFVNSCAVLRIPAILRRISICSIYPLFSDNTKWRDTIPIYRIEMLDFYP